VNCLDCDKRKYCSSLCASAEEYVNQDYGGYTLWNVGDMDSFDSSMSIDKMTSFGDIPEEWLDSLSSPRQREILELYYNEGKTQKYIADLLRLSVGTVATYLKRGRLMLKKYLSIKD